MSLIETTPLSPLRLVIGPEGQPLTLADLPSATTRRWVTKRKAIVVAAVKSGLLSLEDACERYTLSTEEFQSWQSLIEQHGIPGLRATRVQHYRPNFTLPAAAEKKSRDYLSLVREQGRYDRH
jgi:hypothetical protein